MARRCITTLPLPLRAFAVAVFGLFSLAADALAVDGKVHVLKEAGFAGSVQKFPYTFVEFYAPWCGHCKSLEPEWEKTATLAAAISVPIAKVDAIAEEKLAQAQGVKSFPTLKLFRGDPDVVAQYNGPRTASSMIDWLGKWTKTQNLPRPQPTQAGVKAWAPTAKLKVLGLLSGQDDADKPAIEFLEAAAFMLNPSGPGTEVPVALVALPGGEMHSIGISGISLPGIVLLRDFDFEDRVVHYEDDLTKGMKPFSAWFDQRRQPALIPATKDTEQVFLSDIEAGNALAILFGSDHNSTATMQQLAVEMAPVKKLKWVHAKEDEFGRSLGKNVGVEATEFPDVVIWQFGDTEDDDRVFKLSVQLGHSGFPTSSEELNLAVRQLILDWQSGTLSDTKHDSKGVQESSPQTSQTTTTPSFNPPAKTSRPKEVPCPIDANIFDCATWCEESSSDLEKLVGTLGGKPCAEWKPSDPPHDRTTCSCYDEEFTEVKKTCYPECRKSMASAGGAHRAIDNAEADSSDEGGAHRAIDNAEADSSDEDMDTCAAGDDSCNAGPTRTTTPSSGIYDDDIAADF